MADGSAHRSSKRIRRTYRVLRRRIVLLLGLSAASVLALAWLGNATLESDPASATGRGTLLAAALLGAGVMAAAGYRLVRSTLRREQFELELDANREFLRALFDATPDVVYVYDLLERRHRHINRGVSEALGYTPEAVLAMGDRLVSILVHPEDAGKMARAHSALLKAPDGQPVDAEFRVQHADGTWRWLRTREVVFQRDREGHPTQLLGLAGDVTSRKAAEHALAEANEQLERLAATDPLTGVANRRTLMRRLEHEARRTRRSEAPLSLVLLDVDHFKAYNDDFGHPAGDEVLKAVALALKEALRETDLVARHGGEEFAAVLPETAEPEALATAERLRQTIQGLVLPHRAVTASLGVATRGVPVDVEALVQAADSALYEAKRSGRNRVAGGAATPTCEP